MSDVRDYWFLYKCRCCGKRFLSGKTRCTQETAIGVLVDFQIGKYCSDKVEGATSSIIHHCDDINTLGYADIIGISPNPNRFNDERKFTNL